MTAQMHRVRNQFDTHRAPAAVATPTCCCCCCCLASTLGTAIYCGSEVEAHARANQMPTGMRWALALAPLGAVGIVLVPAAVLSANLYYEIFNRAAFEAWTGNGLGLLITLIMAAPVLLAIFYRASGGPWWKGALLGLAVCLGIAVEFWIAVYLLFYTAGIGYLLMVILVLLLVPAASGAARERILHPWPPKEEAHD